MAILAASPEVVAWRPILQQFGSGESSHGIRVKKKSKMKEEIISGG
jgi:hypothetical protein